MLLELKLKRSSRPTWDQVALSGTIILDATVALKARRVCHVPSHDQLTSWTQNITKHGKSIKASIASEIRVNYFLSLTVTTLLTTSTSN